MRAAIVCITLLLALPAYSAAGLQRAGTCGGCHVENFNAWRSSAHARSVSSDGFRSALSRYLIEEDTDDGGFCFGCHAPAILISGGRFEATKGVLKGKRPLEGVGCVACHSVESVKDGRAVYDPGDSPGYHTVKDLRSVDREGLCTTCHSAYEPPGTHEAIDEGMVRGLASRLGRIVGTKAVKRSDHTFSGTAVEDGSCPGMEKD